MAASALLSLCGRLRPADGLILLVVQRIRKPFRYAFTDSSLRSGLSDTVPAMKALVTGGAGLHRLPPVRALARRGRGGLRPRRPLDRLGARISPICARAPEFHLVVDSVLSPSVVSELVHRCDVVYHLAAAVGVAPDRRAARAHAADERPGHGERARVLRALREAQCSSRRAPRSTETTPRSASLRRGRAPHLRPDDREALGLRRHEGDRRVPRARATDETRPRLCDRAAVQHGRPAPERPVRERHPALRRGGARRRAARDPRRRHADALLLPRLRHRPRAARPGRGAGDRAARSTTSARPTGSRSSTWHSACSSHRARAPSSSSSPTRRSTGGGSRGDVPPGAVDRQDHRRRSAGSPRSTSTRSSPTSSRTAALQLRPSIRAAPELSRPRALPR